MRGSGTEIVATFSKPVDAGVIRKSLEEGGYKNVDVSTYAIKDGEKTIPGYLLRLAQFGAVDPVKGGKFAAATDWFKAYRDVVENAVKTAE